MGSDICGTGHRRGPSRRTVLVHDGEVVVGKTVASGKSSGENSRRRAIMKI